MSHLNRHTNWPVSILQTLGHLPYLFFLYLVVCLLFLATAVNRFFTSLKTQPPPPKTSPPASPATHQHRLLIPLLKSLYLSTCKLHRRLAFVPSLFTRFFRYFTTSLLRFNSWLKSSISATQTRISHLRHQVHLAVSTALNQLKLSLRFPLPQLGFKTKLTLLLAIAGIFVLYFTILKDLPSPYRLTRRDQPVTTRIFDRHGALLYKIYKDQNRSLVNLADVPPQLIQATLAIEDQNFYSHAGFSTRGIIRALKRNLIDKSIEGGSTITQQLVKNALLTPERTIKRKIKELVLAIEVELIYSKDEILTMYFNEVSYGGTAYGVEEASQLYFAKPVSQLDLAEAALLAGLPAAPSAYSPFGAHPETAKDRQLEVLRRMYEEGYITAKQAQLAGAEKLSYAPNQIDIRAPHFVMYVKDQLIKKYGEKMVEEGGLQVYTTLDLDLQTIAQATVSAEIAKLGRYHVGNGAALVTNPKSGEILAMVGSKDYFDFASDGNVNLTLALRQPGSSIKPVNYITALSEGYTPASIIIDAPITFQIPGQPPYSPVNYDGRYHGRVTLRTALASSYNIPSVKILASYGYKKMLATGTQMGITTWTDPSRYGLSLALGGGDVHMTDMAVVYGTLANGGNQVALHSILKVTDSDGRILEKFNCPYSGFQPSFVLPARAAGPDTTICKPKKVVKPELAYIITDILSDNAARTPAFGPKSLLYYPDYQVAVKTGTTNYKRDNWAIGYTPNYVTAAWVGNNDNTPMNPYITSGITGATPIWRGIMDQLIARYPPEPFPIPKNLTRVKICTIDGRLTCAGCPTRDELFVKGTEPTRHCSASAIAKIIEAKKPTTLTPTPEVL